VGRFGRLRTWITFSRAVAQSEEYAEQGQQAQTNQEQLQVAGNQRNLIAFSLRHLWPLKPSVLERRTVRQFAGRSAGLRFVSEGPDHARDEAELIAAKAASQEVLLDVKSLKDREIPKYVQSQMFGSYVAGRWLCGFPPPSGRPARSCGCVQLFSLSLPGISTTKRKAHTEYFRVHRHVG
jgi:hypothetical protein